jgi:hypothetical protein
MYNFTIEIQFIFSVFNEVIGVVSIYSSLLSPPHSLSLIHLQSFNIELERQLLYWVELLNLFSIKRYIDRLNESSFVTWNFFR